MEIVSVPGYVHVVPVVVIQRAVRVALDQVCPVAQVRYVVQVARAGHKERREEVVKKVRKEKAD